MADNNEKIDTGPVLGCLLILFCAVLTGLLFAAPFWWFGGTVSNVLGCLVWVSMTIIGCVVWTIIFAMCFGNNDDDNNDDGDDDNEEHPEPDPPPSAKNRIGNFYERHKPSVN